MRMLVRFDALSSALGFLGLRYLSVIIIIIKIIIIIMIIIITIIMETCIFLFAENKYIEIEA